MGANLEGIWEGVQEIDRKVDDLLIKIVVTPEQVIGLDASLEGTFFRLVGETNNANMWQGAGMYWYSDSGSTRTGYIDMTTADVMELVNPKDSALAIHLKSYENDAVGIVSTIHHYGRDDGDAEQEYARQHVVINSAEAGGEYGEFQWQLIEDGAFPSTLNQMRLTGGRSTPTDFYLQSEQGSDGNEFATIQFWAMDSQPQIEKYAEITAKIIDNTTTTEDGSLYFSVVKAGVNTKIVEILSTKVTIDGDLEFTGAQSITTSADNLTLNPGGLLTFSKGLSGDWDAGGYEIRSLKFQSDQTTGTAPLIVASTTVVTNLNADLLDGSQASAFILHSLADAANDFLVASGANTFVKKTLAETGAILEGDIDHGNIQGLDTGADHSYIDQDVTTTANATFATLTLNNDGLHLLDNNATHDLIITPGSNLTADRVLTLITGDVARTVTILGNPTLSDWFDQSVKTTAGPTFDNVTLQSTAAVLLHIDGQDSGTADLRFSNSTDTDGWYTGITGAEKFGISRNINIDAGAEFIMLQTGEVGFGTATPESLVQLEGASGLDGATPITLNLNSTNNGSWTAQSTFAQIDFATDDVGGVGDGTKARIEAIVATASGGVIELAFSIASGQSTLDEAIRINFSGDVGVGIATGISAQLHIDQASATGAQPVLFLDQGDVSEQIIKASYSGADVDMILIDIDVTGSPQFGWSETPNVFTLNKGLTITGSLDTDGFIGNTVEKSSGYTATATDFGIMCDASGGGFTITLPAAASHTGRVYHIKKIDLSGNLVTVDGASSETVDDATTAVLTVQYESITIQSDGDEWMIL